MQKVMIVGNLGGGAEQKAVGDQTVVEFSVAVNRKDKGEESTAWYRCSFWGQRGVAVAQYLTKGKKVAVAGDLNARAYEGRNGAGFSLDVRVDSLTLCDGGGNGEKRGAQGNASDDPDPF
ncbi:MAG: single-stranded DNA-binding protein [Polyangiaceae bacterium]